MQLFVKNKKSKLRNPPAGQYLYQFAKSIFGGDGDPNNVGRDKSQQGTNFGNI